MEFLIDLSTLRFGEISQLTRIPLALLGRWVKGSQKFAITREIVTAMVLNFRKRQADLVIDYEHASEFPELAKGGPVPAAGWLQQVEDAPDERGVLWGLAELTQRAREMIEAREYKYISPAINWGARDKVTGEPQGATLQSIALVNRPFLEAMPAIQLSEAGWQIIDEKEKTMKAKKVTLAEGGNLAVATCGEDGEEIRVEIDLEQAGLARAPKVVALSDVKRTKDGRYDFGSIEPEEGTLIAGEVFHAINVQTELDAAVKETKILPAQRAHYEKLALSDLDGFRDLVKTLKPQVELGERGFAGDGGGTELTELARIDKQFHALTEEKLKASPDMTYSQAMKLVARENTDLDKRRTQLLREGS